LVRLLWEFLDLVLSVLSPVISRLYHAKYMCNWDCADTTITGSVAAGAQVPVTVAGGLFATATSAAMGGSGVAVMTTVVQGAGAVLVGGAIAVGAFFG
jgi:hypothetical protein